MSDKVYITAADTARMIRKDLKREFPGQKFYVRTSTYSGGASISIDWMDGPTTAEVDTVVKVYEGADFDGMIDLKTYISHWMLPDGSVQIAKTTGTEGSGGFIHRIETDKPHPDAKLVHFMADYINGSRAYSREFVDRVAAQVTAEIGWDAPEIVEWCWYVGKSRGKQYSFKSDYSTDSEYIARAFDQAARETSARNGKSN